MLRLTGRIEFNPWADFNLSGQFVSESWGLISPGMPQTAARIGLHYTHVSVDGEAVQSTQMVDAMIATAFLTNDMEKIVDAGAAALDPKSVMSQIMTDVRAWQKQNPRDWRATRKLTMDKYCKYGGHDMRDRNGVWLNGASTVSALLYGDGDWVQTVRSAFNFGWDADNNAAASGTILGVIKGNKALLSQGWNIKDLYRDTSRDDVPQNETITSYSDRLVELAKRNILEQGGSQATVAGKSVYRINSETPQNVERLPDLKKQYATMRTQLKGEIEKGRDERRIQPGESACRLPGDLPRFRAGAEGETCGAVDRRCRRFAWISASAAGDLLRSAVPGGRQNPREVACGRTAETRNEPETLGVTFQLPLASCWV